MEVPETIKDFNESNSETDENESETVIIEKDLIQITVNPQFDGQGYLIVDGSQGEGGGQIIRTGLAFSCIFQKPVHFVNIRAHRQNPGLGKQHTLIVQLLQYMYSATVSTYAEGTTELIFCPNPPINVTSFECESCTASSITLMIQSILPCLLFGNLSKTVEFRGGTNGTKAPSVEYFMNVLKPVLKRIGADFVLDVKKKSYVSTGGGLANLTVIPIQSLKPLQLEERGKVEKIKISSFYTGTVHAEVPQRMVQDAIKRIDVIVQSENVNKNNITCEIIKEAKVVGSTGGIILVTETSTGGIFSTFSLGGRGVNAEKVSKTATNVMLRNLKKGGAVDEFLQDQLLIYCALAKGNSKIRTGPLTQHTMSIIHLIRLMCPTSNILIKKTKLENRTQPEEKKLYY